MLTEIFKHLRFLITNMFPGRFPSFYSTLDNPQEVPVQMAAYQLVKHKYIQTEDNVLDVGFGLGYGMKIMAENVGELKGIEIDQRAVIRGKKLFGDISKIHELRYYDGYTIPYNDEAFDVVACVDVLEHVPDYKNLIGEMIRVSNRIVLISTPNRRPEYTKPDGSPKNRWHLREWTFDELDSILSEFRGIDVEWHFINGSWDGPFEYTTELSKETMALTPAIILKE